MQTNLTAIQRDVINRITTAGYSETPFYPDSIFPSSAQSPRYYRQLSKALEQLGRKGFVTFTMGQGYRLTA